MQRFENRIAAVIGGGSGMGRAISHRLASEGATVYVADLSEESANTVAAEIVAEGGKANAAPVNAKMQSWLTRHRARLLAALKAGPKSLFEFLDDGMLAIETPFDIAGLFGTYVMVEPFGKRVAVVVERREGLKAVDRVGHRLTASDIRLRLEEKTR